MLKHASRTLAALVLGAAMTGATASADNEIKIGWTAWSDAEFVTKLAERILEDEMGYDVELVQTDIAPQYEGVAGGSIDLMLMSWLPDTHGDYMDRVAGDVVDLGALYTGARLGWVVPEYVPESELSSLEDLNDDEVRENLDGQITGIDPGAGLTSLSEQAIEDYGLDYELQLSSDAGMTAALERAYGREDWIVATGWSPHWKFGAYELRYLEDPKGSLGGPERIHALAREGFPAEFQDATAMITRMYIPIDDLQEYMYFAQENSYEEAVEKYLEENETRVNYWVTGDL